MFAAAEKGRDHPLPETEAVARTIDAELLRCEGSSDAEVWGGVAAQWDDLGQPSRRPTRSGGRPSVW